MPALTYAPKMLERLRPVPLAAREGLPEPRVKVGNYSITQNGSAADKTAKDNNFRGETVFNNTLYVSKGSGGNGTNSVYQVGVAGSLPTAANAAGASISIRPVLRQSDHAVCGRRGQPEPFRHGSQQPECGPGEVQPHQQLLDPRLHLAGRLEPGPDVRRRGPARSTRPPTACGTSPAR